MADYPAMPLWTDAYLADTRHLNAPEHGAYMLLLMEAWRRRNCSLPDDDRLLARLACMTQTEWEASKPTVMEFWKYDGRSKTWTQKRLMKERGFVQKKSRSQREKAAKRWDSEKKPDATAVPKLCQGDAPTPTPTPTPTVSEPKGSGADAPPDPAKVMFDSGVELLTGAGVKEGQARSMLGKWRKVYGEEAVISAIGRARREAAINPVEFITGCLRFQKKSSQPQDGDRRERNGQSEVYAVGMGWVPEFT